jgi:hypothetical protein
MGERWDHDLALSVHSYYQNEIKCGIRACERGLSYETPYSVENRFRSNYSFYIQCLGENYDVEFSKLIIPNIPDGYVIFNPSIINYDNSILVFIRTSNYTIKEGKYIFQDRGVDTFYYWGELNKKGEIINPRIISGPDYQKSHYPVNGIEDIRLYRVDDQLHGSGTVRNMAPYSEKAYIATVRFDPGKSHFHDMKVMKTPNGSNIHEKNWMPIIGPGHRWLYNCYDNGSIRSIDDKGQWTTEHKSNYVFRGFRGGSQLIPYREGYLGVIHELYIKNDGGRCYSHRFVRFSNDLNIQDYTLPFFIKERFGIEYVAGIIVKDENSILLSFGIMDKEAWIVRISKNTINHLFDVRHEVMDEDCSIRNF